jgi:hypothetical protein
MSCNGKFLEICSLLCGEDTRSELKPLSFCVNIAKNSLCFIFVFALTKLGLYSVE